MNNSLLSESKWSLVKLCIVFFSVTTILFIVMILALLVPRVNTVFNDFTAEADKTTMYAYAEKLNQYIHSRELALKDIAKNPLIVNSALQGDGERPALLDYIAYVSILGEDPTLTIIDIAGNILLSESDQASNYQWVEPVLSMDTDRQINIVENTEPPQFEIAVPVAYGGRTEGVLVARISAEAYKLYGDSNFVNNNLMLTFSKNNKSIVSKFGVIQQAHNESTLLPDFNINFTYTSDRQPVIKDKSTLLKRFILFTIFSCFALFSFLFLVGRTVILKPFDELTTLQRAISSAVEGISYIDPQGRYISLNEAYAGAAGYKPSELEGKPWSITVFKDDLPSLNDAYATMLKEGKVIAEARGVKKDGSIFYKRVTMICEYNKKGEFIGHHCFLKDITAAKISEEKIRKQQQDLQLIFDNVPVKIWYKDDKNKILRINKNAAESMGGEVADFEGKDTYDLFPEMAKKYHIDDLEVMNTNIPKTNIVEKYTPINCAPSWVSTDKIPYIDPVTKEKFIFVCSKDITKEKLDEENLRRLNDELSQFAYRTSHDLKAPLVSISGLVNFILEDLEAGELEEVKLNAKMIKSQSDKLSSLVTDILELARADFSDNTAEPIDFNVLIDEIINDLSVSIDQSGIVVSKEIQEPLTFSLQKTRIKQVLYNLLSNAVKYSDPLKKQKSININVKIEGDSLVVLVEDNGLGFPQNNKKDIFKMFKRFHPKVSVGSGLGLSIIKKHVDSMGGYIELYEPSPITCFRLTFPST